MLNVHIDYRGSDHGFQAASLLAKDAAKENKMKDPTIIAWHQDSRLGQMASSSNIEAAEAASLAMKKPLIVQLVHPTLRTTGPDHSRLAVLPNDA